MIGKPAKRARYSPLWVNPQTKNAVKARAAKEGLKINQYMEKLMEEGKFEDEKTAKKHGFGFLK